MKRLNIHFKCIHFSHEKPWLLLRAASWTILNMLITVSNFFVCFFNHISFVLKSVTESEDGNMAWGRGWRFWKGGSMNWLWLCEGSSGEIIVLLQPAGLIPFRLLLWTGSRWELPGPPVPVRAHLITVHRQATSGARELIGGNKRGPQSCSWPWFSPLNIVLIITKPRTGQERPAWGLI